MLPQLVSESITDYWNNEGPSPREEFGSDRDAMTLLGLVYPDNGLPALKLDEEVIRARDELLTLVPDLDKQLHELVDRLPTPRRGIYKIAKLLSYSQRLTEHIMLRMARAVPIADGIGYSRSIRLIALLQKARDSYLHGLSPEMRRRVIRFLANNHASDIADSDVTIGTAIAAAFLISDLLRIRHFYSGAIDDNEFREHHSVLVSHVDGPIGATAPAELQETSHELKSTEASKWLEVRWSAASLILLHPEIVSVTRLYDLGKEGDAQHRLNTLLNAFIEQSPEPVRKVASAIVEIRVWRCRTPDVGRDSTLDDPRRYVELLNCYWSNLAPLIQLLAEQLLVVRPNPLMAWMTNAKARLDDCLEILKAVDGCAEVRSDMASVIDLAVSDPGELQMADDWVHSKIDSVYLFVQKARLKLGAKALILTDEERTFIQMFEHSIAEFSDVSKRRDTVFKQNLETKLAAAPPPATALVVNANPSDKRAPASARYSKRKMTMALEFIRERGPVKAVLIAKHIGVEENTFRSNYVPALIASGMSNDRTGDGYYDPVLKRAT